MHTNKYNQTTQKQNHATIKVHNDKITRQNHANVAHLSKQTTRQDKITRQQNARHCSTDVNVCTSTPIIHRVHVLVPAQSAYQTAPSAPTPTRTTLPLCCTVCGGDVEVMDECVGEWDVNEMCGWENWCDGWMCWMNVLVNEIWMCVDKMWVRCVNERIDVDKCG